MQRQVIGAGCSEWRENDSANRETIQYNNNKCCQKYLNYNIM